MTELTEAHHDLLKEWSSVGVGYGYHFKALGHRTGLPREQIRPLVRDLAHEGFLAFERGCWTEDGEPYGSAYVLTEVGRAAITKEAEANG